MFRKILKIIICTLVLIYVLTAPYFLNNEYIDKYLTESPQNKWSGIITMWDVPRMNINGSEFGWIKSRIAAYSKVNPNVHIELRELHYEDNKEIAFHAAIDEDYPDIMPFFVENEVVPLDNVSPLTSEAKNYASLNIREDILSSVYRNGEIWAVPVYYSINVLIVNKDILNSLDIKLEDEYDFSTFLSLLKEIDKKGDDDSAVIPFDFYIGDGSCSYMPFILSDRDVLSNQDDNNLEFYDDDVITGLQKLNTIKKALQNLPEDFGYRSRKQVMDDFLNQKTAIIAGNLNDVNSTIRKQNQGSGFNYSIISYPKGKTGNTVYFADEICSYAIMNTEDSEKEKAIWDFLNFLLNEESQSSLESVGKLPVVDIYSYTYEKYHHLEGFDDLALVHTIPLTVERNQIFNAINKKLTNMFLNNQPVTETLYKLQKAIDNIRIGGQ